MHILTLISLTFVAVMGGIVLICVLRYILPWLIILGLITAATCAGFGLYERHQAGLHTKAAQAEAQATRSEAAAQVPAPPRLEPIRKAKPRKVVATSYDKWVDFCKHHPHTRACAEFD